MSEVFETSIRYSKLIDRQTQKVVGLIAYRYTNNFTVLEYGLSIVHPDEMYNFEVGSKYALTRLQEKDPKFYRSVHINQVLRDFFLFDEGSFIKPKFSSLSRSCLEQVIAFSATEMFHYPVSIRFTHRYLNRGN